jgi:hypothetical protein
MRKPAKNTPRVKKKSSASLRRARSLAPKAKAGRAKARVKTKPVQARRAETEAAIIAAFEKVLLRDGAAKIAINAIAREAKVAKPMIYDYFGGLGGLLIAWNKKNAFVPQVSGDVTLGKGREADANTLADILIQLGNNLKNSPARLEIHADEISPHSVFQPYQADIFTNLPCATDKFFDQFPHKPNIQQQQVFSVMLAALMYLALRKRSSPTFLNLDFATDSGWAKTMRLFADVAKRALAAK